MYEISGKYHTTVKLLVHRPPPPLPSERRFKENAPDDRDHSQERVIIAGGATMGAGATQPGRWREGRRPGDPRLAGCGGALSYRVQVCSDQACTQLTRSLTATNSLLKLAPLAPGTYWWRVQAVGRVAASAW